MHRNQSIYIKNFEFHQQQRNIGFNEDNDYGSLDQGEVRTFNILRNQYPNCHPGAVIYEIQRDWLPTNHQPQLNITVRGDSPLAKHHQAYACLFVQHFTT